MQAQVKALLVGKSVCCALDSQKCLCFYRNLGGTTEMSSLRPFFGRKAFLFVEGRE